VEADPPPRWGRPCRHSRPTRLGRVHRGNDDGTRQVERQCNTGDPLGWWRGPPTRSSRELASAPAEVGEVRSTGEAG
jgi:hypothetical protein